MGLTADAPFCLPGTAGTGGFPENMSPRGYMGDAMGYVQSINNWKNNNTPELYIHYALINPF